VSPSSTLYGCRRRADALWAGWEFIADPAEVAGSCERGDIADIGPGSDVIRLLGDKTRRFPTGLNPRHYTVGFDDLEDGAWQLANCRIRSCRTSTTTRNLDNGGMYRTRVSTW
jgi:hypothetical protein